MQSETGSRSENWFVWIQSGYRGPFSFEQVSDLLVQSILSENVCVWKEGMAEWKEIKNVSEFDSVPKWKVDAFKTEDYFRRFDLSQALSRKIDFVSDDISPRTVFSSSEEPIQDDFQFNNSLDFAQRSVLIDETNEILEQKKKRDIRRKILKNAYRVFGVVVTLGLAYSLYLKLSYHDIEDISKVENQEIKNVVRTSASDGPLFSVALVARSLRDPEIVIGTNLDKNEKISITIDGVKDSLVGAITYHKMHMVTLQGNVERVKLFDDNENVPRGRFQLSVQCESCRIKETNKPFRKMLFLGGAEDATYLAQLTKYHLRLKEEAAAELGELTQIVSSLEGQFSSLQKIESVVSARQFKLWQKSQTEWLNFHNQISEVIKTTMLNPELFYSNTYAIARQVVEAQAELQELEHQLLGKHFANELEQQRTNDVETLSASVTTKVHQIEGLISSLKAKVTILGSSPSKGDLPPLETSD